MEIDGEEESELMLQNIYIIYKPTLYISYFFLFCSVFFFLCFARRVFRCGLLYIHTIVFSFFAFGGNDVRFYGKTRFNDNNGGMWNSDGGDLV